MSIKQISAAWKTAVADPKAKLVLLKLADNANDKGVAWPKVETIAADTGLSRRSVYRALDWLEDAGIVTRNRGRNEVYYEISKCHTDTSTSANVTPQKCQRDTSTSATQTPQKCQADTYANKGTVIEPYIVQTSQDPEKTKRFSKPTVQEVTEHGATLTPRFLKAQQFWDYYESKGWVVGRSPMKNWKAAVRTWQARDQPNHKPQTSDQFKI